MDTWSHVTLHTLLLLCVKTVPMFLLLIVNVIRRDSIAYANQLLIREAILRRRCSTLFEQLQQLALGRKGDAEKKFSAEFKRSRIDVAKGDSNYVYSLNFFLDNLEQLTDEESDEEHEDSRDIEVQLDQSKCNVLITNTNTNIQDVIDINNDESNMKNDAKINDEKTTDARYILPKHNNELSKDKGIQVNRIQNGEDRERGITSVPVMESFKFAKQKLSCRTRERLNELEILSKSIYDSSMSSNKHSSKHSSFVTNAIGEKQARNNKYADKKMNVDIGNCSGDAGYISLENASYDVVFGINKPSKLENSTSEDNNQKITKIGCNKDECESDSITIYKTIYGDKECNDNLSNNSSNENDTTYNTIYTNPSKTTLNSKAYSKYKSTSDGEVDVNACNTVQQLHHDSETKFIDCIENSIIDEKISSSIRFSTNEILEPNHKYPISCGNAILDDTNKIKGEQLKYTRKNKVVNRKEVIDKTKDIKPRKKFNQVGKNRIQVRDNESITTKKSKNASEEIINAIEAIEVLAKPRPVVDLNIPNIKPTSNITKKIKEDVIISQEMNNKRYNNNNNKMYNTENRQLNIDHNINMPVLKNEDGKIVYCSEYMRQFSKETKKKNNIISSGVKNLFRENFINLNIKKNLSNKCSINNKHIVSKVKSSTTNSALNKSDTYNNTILGGNAMFSDNPAKYDTDNIANPPSITNYLKPSLLKSGVYSNKRYYVRDGGYNSPANPNESQNEDRIKYIVNQKSDDVLFPEFIKVNKIYEDCEYLRPLLGSYRSYVKQYKCLTSLDNESLCKTVGINGEIDFKYSQASRNSSKLSEHKSNLKLLLNHRNGDKIKDILLECNF